MSLHAEALARALGVWWDPAKRNGAMSGLVVTDRETALGMRQLLVQTNMTADSSWAADAWAHVDARTLALILLGHRRGLRLDLGPCRMCGGAGDIETGVEHHGMRETLQCPECSEPCERCKGSGDVPGGPATWENPWGDAPDSCPDCLGYGILAKPGGRHTVPWPDAVIAAMPKTSWVHKDGATFGPFESAGDQATRDALGVLADHMQANPDPCAFCRGTRWGYLVDKIGPGVTIEEMNPRREICMICEGSGVDEHGAHKVEIGQRLAAWLCGALADLGGVLERLVDEAIVNAE